MRASPNGLGRSRGAFSFSTLALAISGVGLAASPSFGQTAYTNPATDPAAWTQTFSIPNLSGTGTVSNPPTTNYYSSISAAANSGLIQLKGNGFANDPVGASGGTFELVNRGQQVFNITGNTEVGVPLYLRGTISFTGVSAVTHGFVNGTSLIRDLSDNSVKMSVSYTDSVFSNQFSGVYYDIFKYSSVTLPTGNYRLETSLDITGQAEDTVFTTQSVTNDFTSTVRGGLASVLSLAPAGLQNSRAKVTAVQARSDFNLTGAGVKVGILEPGRPYLDSDSASSLGIKKHASFGTRLSISNVAGEAVNLRSEHTQAVASIIGSADGDTGKAGIAPGATLISAPDSTYATFQAQLTDTITTKGCRVLNMSAGFSDGLEHSDTRVIDNQIIATPNVTFVKSAGNSSNFLTGARGNVSAPGLAYNGITVGGLDRAMVGRAAYSSYGTNLTFPATASSDPPYPTKPDIVAPSEYVQVAAARDLDGNTNSDDWTRAFLGDGMDATSIQVGDVARHQLRGSARRGRRSADVRVFRQEQRRASSGPSRDQGDHAQRRQPDDPEAFRWRGVGADQGRGGNLRQPAVGQRIARSRARRRSARHATGDVRVSAMGIEGHGEQRRCKVSHRRFADRQPLRVGFRASHRPGSGRPRPS